MHTFQLSTLIAALFATVTVSAALLPRQSTTTVSLGEITFGTPTCGDAPIQSISGTNCTSALSALFAENCINNLCSIPGAGPEAQESVITATVGACEVIVGVFVGGQPATFAQDSVAKEFPGFIDACLAPGVVSGHGNPIVLSTDGRVRLLFSNGLPIGPE